MNLTRNKLISAWLMCGALGCSTEEVAQVPETPSLAMTSAAPASDAEKVPDFSQQTAATPNSTGQASPAEPKAEEKIEAFKNPFAMPKLPPPPPEPEPEPEPEPDPEPIVDGRRPPPKIRLVGFLNVGQPSALLEVRDELQIVMLGDVIRGLNVIGIESPQLTLKYYDEEIKMDLFDQKWRHSSAASRDRGSVQPPTSRSQTTPTSASGYSLGGVGRHSGHPATPGAVRRGPPGIAAGMPSLPGLGGPSAGGLPGPPSTPSGGPGAGRDLPGLSEGGNAKEWSSGIPSLPGFGSDSEGEGPDELFGLPGEMPDF